MKNKLYMITAFLLLIGINGCKEESQIDIGPRGVGIVPIIEATGASFFDFLNMQNTEIAFDVKLPENISMDETSVIVSYNGDGQRVVVETKNSFPASFTVSATQVTQLLNVDINSVAVGDVFTFEVLLKNGSTITRSNAVVNANVACGIAAAFEGSYKIEYVSGAETTVFGIPIFINGEVIDVVKTGYTGRKFAFSYLGGDFGLIDLNFDLSCGEVIATYSTSGVGCGGPGLNLGESPNKYQFNPDDDSEFTISFFENIDGGCGGSAQEVVLKLIKQ